MTTLTQLALAYPFASTIANGDLLHVVDISDTSRGSHGSSFGVTASTLRAYMSANSQPLDATLTALAGLTTAADKGIYATGSDTFATFDLGSFGRTWGGLADAAAGRTALSLDSYYQPLDATLTGFAGVSTGANKLIYATGTDTFAATDFSAYGRSLVDDSDAPTARTTLGLGTMATANTSDYYTAAYLNTSQSPASPFIDFYNVLKNSQNYGPLFDSLRLTSGLDMRGSIILNRSVAGDVTDELVYLQCTNVTSGNLDISYGNSLAAAGTFRIINAAGAALSIDNSRNTTIYSLALTNALGVTYGGLGLTSATQGDVLYASGANTWAKLAKNTTATRYLSNTGTSNNPAWAQIDLSNGVTGTLPTANIADGAVTYAKIQNVSATDKILGRSTAGAGVVEEITCTSAARSILDDTSVGAIATTLGLGTGNSPTFTGLNLSGLTASTGVYTDASKNITSTAPATLTFNAINSGTHLPSTSVTYDLGSSSFKWNGLYTNNIADNGTDVTLTATLNTRALLPSSNNTRDIGAVATAYQDIYAYTINLNPNTTSKASMLTGQTTPSGSLSGTAPALTHNGITALFWNSSGFIAISGNTAYKTAGSSWTASSDERLKKNIEDYTVGLETLLQIQPRLFHYKTQDDSEQKHAGVIAQEVQLVYPRCIGEGGDGMLNFDANDLHFMTINAIKELESRLSALENA